MNVAVEVGRRERKRQALHQQLLHCAEQLFIDRGVSGTTVEDIAEAADVARQTVFNHFPYKEALALELAAARVQSVAQRAHALLESGLPALHFLRQVSEWLLEEATEQGEIAAVAARELLHPDPERALRAAEHFPLVSVVEALLLQAREEQTARGDVPIRHMVEIMSHVLIRALARATVATRNQMREELAVCFEIVFNGIRERRN
jgi:AcrR family transcriptional regulator